MFGSWRSSAKLLRYRRFPDDGGGIAREGLKRWPKTASHIFSNNWTLEGQEQKKEYHFQTLQSQET